MPATSCSRAARSSPRRATRSRDRHRPHVPERGAVRPHVRARQHQGRLPQPHLDAASSPTPLRLPKSEPEERRITERAERARRRSWTSPPSPAARPAACRSRYPQARRARPRACRQPEAAPARRARRRPQPRRGRCPARPDPARARSQQVTVLLVEHHMSLVMSVSDQVVAIDFGRKIAEGHAGRGAAQSRCDPRLSGNGGLSGSLLEVRGAGPTTAKRRFCTVSSFSLEPGGITALLGANGAGKTTTLRAICKWCAPRARSRFDGPPINGRATEASCGWAWHTCRRAAAPSPFSRRGEPARRRLHAARPGRAERDMEMRVRALSRSSRRASQQAGTLSGGEQQMLAIAAR